MALCDRSGSGGVAKVLAQYTYDAYGAVLTAEHLTATHARLHCGHKALFLDRLDVGVVDTQFNELPRLVPFAHALYQNRNRVYSPALGRFLQRDPNQTAAALLEASSYHGRGMGALSLAFDLDGLYGDGANLYQYLGSNPWTRNDPLGLYYDPFDMVDEYLAESAASTAAFLAQIGQDARAIAVVAATVASQLPFPAVSFAGELALAILDGEDLSTAVVSASVGLIPGGRLTMVVGRMAGRISAQATSMAAQYAARYGAPILKATGSATTKLAQRGGRAASVVGGAVFGGPRDTVVYIAFRGSQPVYVGITKQGTPKRLLQHNSRGRAFSYLQDITPPLPRNLALAIETVIKMSNPHFENKNMPIATANPIFDAAVYAGTSWLRNNGIRFVW